MEKCGFSSVSKILLSAVCEGAGCLFDCKEEGGLDGPGGEGKKGRRPLHGLYERQRCEGKEEGGELVH